MLTSLMDPAIQLSVVINVISALYKEKTPSQAIGLRASVLSGGWRAPSAPCYVGLSREQLLTWQLASSEQASEESQRERERERI